MRILITKEGNTIIQEIDDSYPNIPQMTTNFNRGYSTGHQLRNRKELKQNLMANKFSLTNDKFGNFSKILNNKIPKNLKKSKIKLFRNISNINMEDIEITKDEIKSAKQIKVTEKKIYFPKEFSEKYEKIETDKMSSGIINSSNNILPSISQKKDIFDGLNDSNSIIRNKKYMSLAEIIPNDSIIQMKKKILDDKKKRDKATIITQNDFRTEYEPENDIQKLNNILSESKVNSNKHSLIKYLKEKKLNPLTIKVISKKNGNKINRINKMCQIIFQNEDKEKLFNDFVKNKVKHHLNITKKDFQNEINNMGNNMSLIKERLKKYEKTVDNRERYRDHFNELLYRYWLKKDFERFNKKSTPKPEYFKEYFE